MTQPSIFQAIAGLLPELEELERQPGSPRSPRSGTPAGTDTSRLPFGIVIDDPDEPADATTVTGIKAWAAQWVRAIVGVTIQPRGIMASAQYSLSILHARVACADEPPPDADAIIEEAEAIYARLAHRTGHAPERYGWCTCGGSVWRQDTRAGYSDWLVCDGPAEHWFRDERAYVAAQRGMARAVTQVGRYWVTKGALHAIWPGLKPDTLKKWVKRGHIDVSAGCYDLAQVNRRMAAMATATATPRVASTGPVTTAPSTTATFPSRAIAPEVASPGGPGGEPSTDADTTAGTTATNGQSRPK